MAIKIFIDQGHNPSNPNAGAEGNGLREQDITYEVGRLTATLLDADPAYEVRLSRTSPNEILGTSIASSLAVRVDSANSWGADAFISLHTNASEISSAGGTEGYAFSEASAGFILGGDIVSAISDYTGFENRGMFSRPTLYVLRKTRMPATVIELGFITNYGEAMLMQNDPSLFARAVYTGIQRYYS